MVHPLVITAAATAGIGAAVAFEVAVFRPWRDENWPNGFGQGVRDEFLKLRREVEQAVHEIQDDLRTLRDGRRRSNGHRRLSDDELDDFRRGVGEEASSERAQHEFEMHERQASAYRDRLRASMSETLASGADQREGNRGLRRRRPTEYSGSEEREMETKIAQVPVIDVHTPTSPELPHHRLGDASPSVGDAASLPADSRFNSVRSVSNGQSRLPVDNKTMEGDGDIDADKNDLLGLDFGRQGEPSAAPISTITDEQNDTANQSDPFATIVDGTASSWHAVFSDRAAEQTNMTAPEGSLRLSSASQEDLTDEGHVVLDTNGLSQTLSEQQHSFHDLYTDDAPASNPPDSPFRSNRALHAASETAPSTGSRSGRSEPDFEVLSDTADSEGRWSHLQAPPSPTISSGSEGAGMDNGRGIDVLSMASDGDDSWAELSEAGSEGETRVRSLRG